MADFAARNREGAGESCLRLYGVPRPLLPARARLRRVHVEQARAVEGEERIEVDEAGQPIRRAVGDAGHHRAAVAVPEQHHVAQLLVEEDVHHVPDVGVQADLRRGQVGALPQPGQAQRVDLVPRRLQRRSAILVRCATRRLRTRPEDCRLTRKGRGAEDRPAQVGRRAAGGAPKPPLFGSRCSDAARPDTPDRFARSVRA
jgi:hypothetical protein